MTTHAIAVEITGVGPILWDGPWQLETITIDGQDGFYQLRDVVSRDLMLAESGRPACFLTPRNASYAAFLARAPRGGCST